MKNTKYFINDLIDVFDKFNTLNGMEYKNEIFLYKLSDFYDEIKTTYTDYKNDAEMWDDCGDDITDNFNIITQWLKMGYDNNVLIIDTPNDDDIITFLQFDENENVIGIFEIQTVLENIGNGFTTHNINTHYDMFQLFSVVFGFSFSYQFDNADEITLNDLTTLLHTLYDYLYDKKYEWQYCFAPTSPDFYETSIYDDINIFKKYYMSLIYDNMKNNDINDTIQLFNVLDMLKNNIFYIHWMDDDNIIIVCKPKWNNVNHCMDNVVYNYDFYDNTINKIKWYEPFNYVLCCDLTKI